MSKRFCVAVCVAAAPLVWAQPKPDAPAASDFALTIYSTADPATFDPHTSGQDYRYPGAYKLPGYGVVREIRKIDLAAGDNTIKFTDVASGIDPTTVAFRSLTAPDSTTVLEQNYEYDLVNPDKLLQKYVGHTVIINRKQEPLKDDRTHTPETIQGTLLSYDGQTFVLQTENKQLPVQMLPRTADITEIKLFDLNTGLITKPTLVWKIQATQAGKHDAQVTYQTENLTWRADYNVLVNKDDTAADISAWVSILNESGAAYANAKLKLVAGDVHRLTPPPQRQFQMAQAMKLARADAAPQFAEKAFFEYHLYTLQRATSLANNSTKQIELFPMKSGVGVEKIHVYYGLPSELQPWIADAPNQDRNLGTQSNKKVDVYLKFKNSDKNGLGIPLPAGRLRLYKKDDDGESEFVGEDLIQHTPKDEDVLVRIGSAFDIVGERKQTAFAVDEKAHVMTESFEITLRNHKKEPVKVLVKENLFRWATWEITQSSDKFEKQDARTVHFAVDIAPGGEKKVTYAVKYTW